MGIRFIEKSHKYFNDENVEYMSVTTFLHKFSAPFDKMATSARVAAREGVTQQEILDRWEASSKQACDYGTSIHLKMENFINTGVREEGYDSLYDSFNDIVGEDIKWALKRNPGAVHSELLLWNDEARLAGTADLIIDLNDKEFLVGDFKTNKSIDFYSKWGDYMLKPLEHLTSCNYTIYSLQLSVYAYFYSLMTGKTCRNVFLMYKVDDRWQRIPANFMQHEVKVLMHYYIQHRDEILASAKH